MGQFGVDWVARATAVRPKIENVIGGKPAAIRGDRSILKHSPRDGHLLYSFGAGEDADVEDAVSAAVEAHEAGLWAHMPPHLRKERLLALADLIERDSEEFALDETLDVGKPVSISLDHDVPGAIATFRFNAEASDKFPQTLFGANQNSLSYELRRPFGIVGAIVGWNFPLLLASSKLAPALAAGNSVVLKPSEYTALSAQRLGKLAIEAGIPEGVVNVIHGGPELGKTLARHPAVDLLSFTGSTRTGKQLLIFSGQSNMKKLILECGGKAPTIVFADCRDLDQVAKTIAERAFWNQGQVCTASSRLLVERSIKEELLERIAVYADDYRPADPLLKETRFGALVSNAHKAKVSAYITAAATEGAVIRFQSPFDPPFDEGSYAPAVIFEGVEPHHQIAREEVFGPVLAVLTFDSDEEAVCLANDSDYGLSALLFTSNFARAHALSQQLRCGWIVSSATGRIDASIAPGLLSVGGHRQSGISYEGGFRGLDEYLIKSAVQHCV
jgi:gamma-glutamyl-gamma-aminobutyraldehyde dehydrogenase